MAKGHGFILLRTSGRNCGKDQTLKNYNVVMARKIARIFRVKVVRKWTKA